MVHWSTVNQSQFPPEIEAYHYLRTYYKNIPIENVAISTIFGNILSYRRMQLQKNIRLLST